LPEASDGSFHNKLLNLINSIISNRIDIPDGLSFAAIIGENPSAGARSPKLWNAAFSALGVGTKMVPMDVSRERLNSLLEVLSKTSNFIGGAIAVPHKVAAAKWLGDRVSLEAKGIGAVNCLYRDEFGRIVGTNTDGEASRFSLIEKIGCIKEKKILILGSGGVGRAVSAFMSSGGGHVIWASRNHPSTHEEHQLIGIKQVIAWRDIPTVLSEVNVVINCTTVGGGSQPNQSPISSKDLAILSSDSLVFDVIYDPRPTPLLLLAQEFGLETLDGLIMNREQAVIAFNYAVKLNSQLSVDQLRLAMNIP
jgi:shikimate dehydrogenase